MKTSLRKAGYVLLPLVAYVVVHDITRIILMYIVSIIAGTSSTVYVYIADHDAIFSGVMAIIEMAAGTAVLLFMMKRDGWELSIWDYVNLNGISFYRADKLHKTWVSYAVLVIQAISAAIGLNALLYLTGIAKNPSAYDGAGGKSYSLPLLFGVIMYGFISPAVEELLHRIIIFGRMKRCYPYVVSVIVSSFFFGLYHQNLVQMIYGTLMGILMCLACEYIHTILGAFIVHSLANITVYILGYIGVFSSMGTVRICVICLVIAALTLIWEVVSSFRSARIVGVPYGVDKVGLFFVDE